MLRGNMVPCQSREAVITVRSYCNGVMDSWLQHPRLDKEEKIQSLSQLILFLDSLFDLEDCPKPPLPFVTSKYNSREHKAIFRIQILFREHYTWQGKLIWQDNDQEAVFHSGIELIRLFDEILTE